MATFLFWNICKKPIEHLITQLVQVYDVDVIILAESKIPESNLLYRLNTGTDKRYLRSDPLSPQIQIYSHYSPESILPVEDKGRISIRRFESLGVLLAAVHLPSKLHYIEEDQGHKLRNLAQDIDRAEQRVGHSRTVLVGDLNVNPFEGEVVGFEGLHAMMDRRITERISRRIGDRTRKFFYNPMWGRLGDASPGPPGTYYYDSGGKYINFFWNMFDQVLIRPELLDVFENEDLVVVTQIGETSLLTERGIPNTKLASDHLPIIFRLNL